jgi:hypothetical protein
MKNIVLLISLFLSINLGAYNPQDITIYLSFSNVTDREVSFVLDQGRVFAPSEADKIDGVQGLALTESTRVTIPPFTRNHTVAVSAQCLSSSYAYPRGESFEPSPFRLASNLRNMTQAQVWNEFGYQN